MRMIAVGIAALIATTLSVVSVSAQERSLVFNNMAVEALECAAYYSLAAQGFKNAGKSEPGARFDRMTNDAIEWAKLLTNDAGLKAETIPARLELAFRDQMARIGNSLANISILMTQYNDQVARASTEILDGASRTE